jgi:cardiolipin synthase A/B
MKLIVQPRDGVMPLLSAIRRARKEIDVCIFRCDLKEIEQALQDAVRRGVRVRALLAHTNRRGEKRLRQLEQSMLAAGVSVSHTGDDFRRYHGKMMVIDRRALWLLGFDFTKLDASRSRSFGIVTRHAAELQQALRLFEADTARQPYEGGRGRLVVSPDNARAVLGDFIAKAKRQLLIYDPKVVDPAMITLLSERLDNSVDVRIIGKVAASGRDLPHEAYPGKRLHVRAMVRDGRDAFVGSQSLRTLDLDRRREVGLLLKHPAVVHQLAAIFEEDWALTKSGRRDGTDAVNGIAISTNGLRADSRDAQSA